MVSANHPLLVRDFVRARALHPLPHLTTERSPRARPNGQAHREYARRPPLLLSTRASHPANVVVPHRARSGAVASRGRTVEMDDPSLSKPQLRHLADGLLRRDPEAIRQCIAFMLLETRGLWHGRARAMMARRLKHCELSPTQRDQLVRCITQRLESGDFSEQFRDQLLLRLALVLDPVATRAAGERALASPRSHVRRLAAWVISRPE
jgi:hypothetical protein